MELPTLDRFPREVLAAIDVQRAFIVSRLIVAAERLQVFRVLHGRRMNGASLGRALHIHRSYRDIFLNSLVSLRLLHRKGDIYSNTPFAENYFIAERSIHWTRQYSKECVQAYEALTALEETLTSGRSWASIQGRNTPSYTERMTTDRREAEDFTQMLFHFHRGEAEALAKHLDLSKHHAILDVGGGSGVMSIALARKNPYLRACVLDLAAVCEVAAKNIQHAGLSSRVCTLPGDIRRKLPPGYDVVLLCDIGPISERLLKNVYKSLSPGGLVVAVDRYFSKDRTRPLDRLVASFISSSFGLATRSDMVTAFRSCGLQAVKARNLHRDTWVVTGTKPGKLAKGTTGAKSRSAKSLVGTTARR